MADKDTGIAADVKDLVQTLRDYAKQETVGPLKNLGRYLAFGIAGAVLMAIATVFLSLAAIRVLQSQLTWFDGNFSFVPYLVGIVVLAVVAGLCAMAIGRDGFDTPEVDTTQAKQEQDS